MTQTITSSSTYDDFTTSELDMSRWVFLQYPPGPDGSSWKCEEPNASTETGNRTLAIHVERFERGHDQVAIMDNPKHLLLSTAAFAVPADGRVTFSTEMAATTINATPRDYRDGFAAFNILDMQSGWVFDLCATSDMIFSIYERLPVPGVDSPFTYVVDAPLSGLHVAPGRPHLCEVTLDAARGAAEWRVDGHLVYDRRAIEVPAEVNVGLGLITLHPIADGSSQSLRGQGLSASFGPVSVAVDA